MEFDGTLEPYLTSEVQWDKINELSCSIFKEGHLELIDDLIPLILPIINITYYESIQWLDDRYYAKEDLVQDAVLTLYKDMTLRWDKYIHVDDYYHYYKTVCRNVMINLVHYHHSYYSNDEYDPESEVERSTVDSYKSVETKILKEDIENQIYELACRLGKCRVKQKKAILFLLDSMYRNKSKDYAKMKSKLRVVGVNREQFNFLFEHVLYIYRFAYNYQRAIIKGNSKMQLRMEDVINRFESPTYKILAENYMDSIIPELFAELGPDLAMKFVKTFSGKQITVPRYQEFCDDLVGGTVYALAGGDKDNLYRIASENNLSYRALLRIFNRVSSSLEGRE